MSPPAAREAQGIIDPQRQIDRANRFFQVVFWLLFCFSLGLAFWTGDWAAALLVGLPTALIPTIAIALAPRAVAPRGTHQRDAAHDAHIRAPLRERVGADRVQDDPDER